MNIFQYEQDATDHLSRADERLGVAIARLGRIERETIPDPFEALVSSIVAQQISGKAADTVFARLRALLGELTPQAIVHTDVSDIQKCGLSMRKASYIKGIGEAAHGGEIDFASLHTLPDAEIIAKLSALRGVGVWTAEMLLIFSLNRPDVVSWGDFAIRRGMMNLYGLTELNRNTFEELRRRYAPYGSVASLYLWALSVEPTVTSE